MQAFFLKFYSLPMVRWDKNATKATNVASKDKLVVASLASPSFLHQRL